MLELSNVLFLLLLDFLIECIISHNIELEVGTEQKIIEDSLTITNLVGLGNLLSEYTDMLIILSSILSEILIAHIRNLAEVIRTVHDVLIEQLEVW